MSSYLFLLTFIFECLSDIIATDSKSFHNIHYHKPLAKISYQIPPFYRIEI